MAGLAVGKVLAVMGPKAQLEYGLTEALDIHSPLLPAFSVGTWTIGAAIHFSHKPLSYTVDDIIYDALNDRRINDIFKRYNVTLSPAELR